MHWRIRYILQLFYKVSTFLENLPSYLYQLLPEQAASYLNYASRISIPSYKSPKGAAGFPLPGHESFPENNSSIKMYVIVTYWRR